MCKIAVEDLFHDEYPVFVNDIEIKNGSSIPTYFLMKQLEKEYPDHEFSFVIGTDLVPSLKSWDLGEKMLEEINFVIYLRPGYEIDLTQKNELLPKHFQTIDPSRNILGMISSTEVRDRIKKLREAKEEEEKQREKHAQKEQQDHSPTGQKRSNSVTRTSELEDQTPIDNFLSLRRTHSSF